jgi:hypothetical protein
VPTGRQRRDFSVILPVSHCIRLVAEPGARCWSEPDPHSGHFQGRTRRSPRRLLFLQEPNSLLQVRLRKKYWLMPIFIMMVIFGGLIVLTKGSAIAPLIYTIF